MKKKRVKKTAKTKVEDLKTLQNRWYKILKDEGFQDIEDTNSPNEWLKSWHSLKFQDVTKDHYVTQQYYYNCTNFLRSYEFKNDTQKKIWELYSEGMTGREIARQIKDLKPTYKRTTVNKIIKTLEQKMRENIHASNRT